jgi:hypothetical protein
MSDDLTAGPLFAWLSTEELAQRLGVPLGVAQRRAFQGRWKRQQGAGAVMRWAVPADVLADPTPTLDRLLGRLEGLEAGLEATRQGLAADLTGLHDRLERELTRGMRVFADLRVVIETQRSAADRQFAGSDE